MAAYDPKRPRPGADAEEPPPVDALLDAAASESVEESTDGELVVVETVTDELLVDDDTGEIVGERIVTDDVVVDTSSGEVVAEEVVIEEITVDGDTGEIQVETTVIDAVLDTEDDAGSEEVADDAERVEVDLRVASPNGSSARVGSEVPVAAAPEEGTANRAVIAALGAAGLLTLILVILLRRRRRAG
jgi:hypothetical protein